MKTKLIRAARWVAAHVKPYRKAIAGFIGPAVVVLGVPLAQLDLPSAADWRRAAGAAIGGVVAVYFAPKNVD